MEIVGELYHGVSLNFDGESTNPSCHVTFQLGPVGAYFDMAGYVTHAEFVEALDGKQDKNELTQDDFDEICV